MLNRLLPIDVKIAITCYLDHPLLNRASLIFRFNNRKTEEIRCLKDTPFFLPVTCDAFLPIEAHLHEYLDGDGAGKEPLLLRLAWH